MILRVLTPQVTEIKSQVISIALNMRHKSDL